MSQPEPITFIVLRVRNANNGILGKEWKREISLGENGSYTPFPKSRTQADLPDTDPYKQDPSMHDYYDEVHTIQSNEPFTFSIKITPPEKLPESYYWELEAKYRYLGRGKGLEGIKAPPHSFSSGVASDPQNRYDTIQLDAFVSMIQDSTDHALASANEQMQGLTKWPWQKTPTPVINQEPEGVYYTGSPLLQDSHPRIRVDRDAGINPDTTEIVFELKETVDAPRLIAVSWPNTFNGKKISVPMLVYFHPHHNQNTGVYSKSPHPWGSEHVLYGLWNTLIYRKDPLIESPYSKGIPYQIAKSGKNVVLVCPLNKISQQKADSKELGIFMKAKWMHWILFEICAYMYRNQQQYVYPVPSPGDVAFASFSLGVKFVVDFLDDNDNKTSVFTKETLKDIYFFDPPQDGNLTHECVRSCRAWDSKNEKRIRMYTQFWHDDLPVLLLDPQHHPPPVDPVRLGWRWDTSRDLSSRNELRTSAYIRQQDWQEIYDYAATRRMPGEKKVSIGRIVFIGEHHLDLSECLGGHTSGQVVWKDRHDETITHTYTITDAANIDITADTFQGPPKEGRYYDANNPDTIAFRIWKREIWVGDMLGGAQLCHQVFAAMCLTDALRRSALAPRLLAPDT